MTGSLLQGFQPVLANGTQAGSVISNQATATYTDPNNPTTPINTTSNVVQVTIAEVAGITVTASGNDFNNDADANGEVSAGDELYFLYTVTNVGNDPTTFRIPNLATTTGPATMNGDLEVSYDGGTTWTPIAGAELITPSQEPGNSVMVRVPVEVNVGAQATDIITVRLGDTPGDAQNQLRTSNGGDVYTVDNLDTAGVTDEIAGAPANGVREASATQEVEVGNRLVSYTLATVLKVRSGYDDNGTPQATGALTNPITDDTLTYDLGLRVESSDTTGNNFTPAPLRGNVLPNLQTGTVLTSATDEYILVSDAIPDNVDFESVSTPPLGWTVVYATDTVAAVPDATQANWSETAPATLADVTRIGFVYNTSQRGTLAAGSDVSGFSIVLGVEDAVTAPSIVVANMAQAFGQSPSGSPVYDESGDQNPSNYGDTTGPGTLPPGAIDADGDNVPDPGTNVTVDPGVVDPAVVGTDPGNNNTGDGSEGGEANTFTVEPPADAQLVNGPAGFPEATGPDGTTETDFTNLSAQVPVGTSPGTLVDPTAVPFSNTFENTGNNPGDVRLLPEAPADPTDLPIGTTVTFSYLGTSATYTWDGATFTTPDTPVIVPNVQPGDVVNYGTEINLPAGTPLSTDAEGADPTDPNAPAIGGFPVPIRASIDTGVDGDPATFTEDAGNTTIDRVYTGYLRLAKEARVLQGSGPAVAPGEDVFSTNNINPTVGNIIEYRITYSNITELQSGVGNVVLEADDIVITEDGTIDPTSNWALDNDANAVIDTSNVVGSANDTQNGTITFSPAGDQTGTTGATDVEVYVNTVPNGLPPQTSGAFTFQRQVN